MKHYPICILFILTSYLLPAQSPGKGLFYGNKYYKEGKYKEAEKDYLKAYNSKKNRDAQYNLGNAQYQQKNFDEAGKQYAEVAAVSTDKSLKSSANYNLGNTFMEKKNWAEAIKAYKECLKVSPGHASSKYNLAYAQRMKQQEDGQKKKQQEQQNKEQKKQDESQNPPKDEKDKNENDQTNKEDPDKPKPRPSKLTKDQANQILNALNQEEKKLKQKKERGNGMPVQLDKDW